MTGFSGARAVLVRPLALAGTVAIVLFATVGQFSHHGHVSLGGYGADVVPLACSWLALAWWTDRFLPTWLCGVTVGVAIRMLVLGHERWSEAAFFGVALAVIGAVALPLSWAMARWEARRGSSESSSSTAPGP